MRILSFPKYAAGMFAAAILLLGCLPGCNVNNPIKVFQQSNAESAVVIIKGGTNFVNCMEDCRQEVQIKNTELRFTVSSNDKKRFPDKNIEDRISEQEWKGILQLIDVEALKKLPDVIGCPDCTDGGAEWVEVNFMDGQTKRTMFEYRNPPQQIRPLVEKLAAIRKTYSERVDKRRQR